MNAWKSELIKLRAYRLSGWLLPLTTAAMTGVALFMLVIAAQAHRSGDPDGAALAGVAIAPGSGTFLSGLLVGILATIVVTADFSSGVMNLSLMTLPRGRLFVAKAAIGLVAAALVSLVGVIGVGVAAVIVLPNELLARALATPELWGNVFGTLMTHLTWAAMGVATAFMLRRSARVLGVLLLLTLGAPTLGATLGAFGHKWAADLINLLPAGLMAQATEGAVRGEGAVPHLWFASLGLLAWCVVFLVLGWVAFRRAR